MDIDDDTNDMFEFESKGCQTETKSFNDAQTQTNFFNNVLLKEIDSKFSISDVGDLLNMLIHECGDFNFKQTRILSTSVYLLMRIVGVKYEECRNLMKVLPLLTIQTCHEWLNTIKDEDDISVILRDKRGSHKHIEFYDDYPELEREVKAYVMSEMSKNTCEFDAKKLAKFVDTRFRDIYKEESADFGLDSNKLIRSESSCKTDLIKWDCKWDKNSNRPYFEGHERPDVVEKRKEFVNHFFRKKDEYYYPVKINENDYEWNKPTRVFRILLSHDESTFRSGEQQKYRWFLPHISSFHKKGNGRSLMLSYFTVQHDSSDLFSLSEEEWNEAILVYPELDKESEFPKYLSRSADAWIEPKKDNYFDNKTILDQFERLFKLIKFKKSFRGHKIEILIDNARTHSAKVYDVNFFNKKAGTNCNYKSIDWVEDGIEKM
jgi:hypothetical protein